ncbi:glycosyltransferase family 4 protein [Bizionia gelidisalsuginis]|uniref:Glycosyltransferase family 4 protein n=1 Tax=Bizionia gelidisalsuginis TaxID=291188 RepID=A0ABY3ME25_9FLAO|nr:glycosyltransferase family 4 protein [Bizionia gelidisalsuginis]
MKIAFLTPEYPHERVGHSGGIGTSIKHLAQALVTQGHSISLLIYGQTEDAIFVVDGITIYLIKNKKFKGLSWWLTRQKIERLINRLHSEDKIDIVEAPDWTGITSFMRLHCPLIIRQNGSDTYFCHLDHRPVKAINKFHEKKALQSADGILAVSQFTGELTNTLFGISLDFKVIPNSITLTDFECDTVSNQPNSPPTILYFGTLIRKKGLLELPYIFNAVHSRFPGAQLILVGKDSPDIKTQSHSTWALMQPLFRASALEQVRYLGPMPYSEMRTHIEQATICVFPTFAEALPVSWLEAMALKRPVVASNVGWAKDIIDDGVNGYLVHPTDHSTYSEHIVSLLNDAEERQVMGEAARQKIESHFSSEIVAAQSVAFYQTYLDI